MIIKELLLYYDSIMRKIWSLDETKTKIIWLTNINPF